MHPLRSAGVCLLLTMVCASGCASFSASSSKPAETLDERTGMTIGALQDPIEFVESAQNAPLTGSRRSSFAYLGPVEWDRSGDVTYGLWIHVAPGNDRPSADLDAAGAATLELDDGPMALTPMHAPAVGRGPYKPVVSWGQTAYFALDAQMLKRMASSRKLILSLRASDAAVRVDFVPSRATQSILTQFTRAQGITDD